MTKAGRRSHPAGESAVSAVASASAMACATLSLFWAPTAAAAAEETAAQLAAMCAACHRLDGRDVGMPPIVRLPPERLVGIMSAFRSGERPSQIMHAVALSLSDEEIAALARYLASPKEETTSP